MADVCYHNIAPTELNRFRVFGGVTVMSHLRCWKAFGLLLP